VQANAEFFRELAQRLLADDAPLDALLAYELRSEVALNWDAPPLSLSSGLFTAVSGRSYDLSDPDAKKALVADGIVTFIDTTRSAIRSLDPSARIAIGFANVGARPFEEARAAILHSSPISSTTTTTRISSNQRRPSRKKWPATASPDPN
jgi:hypothetical protein